MKKFILIMTVLITAQTTNLMAQTTDTDVVNFTAILQEVLNLTVTGGQDQTADFDTPDEYNLGIDAVGTTTITVEATGDWFLEVNAADFSDGGGNIIPIDNLGLWCESTGTNTIGAEVSCAFTALASSMGITAADQMLLDLGAGSNAGGVAENSFNLNWTMGTMNGSMNGLTMLEQLTAGTIGALGTYTTTVNLTLTAY